MPNPGSDAPLRRVTLNIYEEDYLSLKRMFHQGWQTEIRNIIHKRLQENRQTLGAYPSIRRNIGDLE